MLRALNIKASSNITVDNIKLAGPSTNLVYRLNVNQSTGVSLSRISVPGVAGTFDDPTSCAMMVRSSSDVTLSQYYIGWANNGVCFLDDTNLTISGGILRNMHVDGIHGGAVQGMLIQGNDIAQFHPPVGAHPDGIQVFATPTVTGSSNIVITDNLVSRDGGGISQGIFLRDTSLVHPFQNVKISNNVVSGGMYNGIALGQTITGRIVNNTVIGYPDMKSWIRVTQPQDVNVEDSVANAFLLDPGVGQGGNMVVPQDQAAADQAAAAWRSAHGY